jgi:hypothetical protein
MFTFVAHIKMLQRETTTHAHVYKNGRRETKLICKRKKKQYEEHILEQLEERFRSHDSYRFDEGMHEVWVFNQENIFVKISMES